MWEKRFEDVLEDQLATDGLNQVDLGANPDLWAVVHARLSTDTRVYSYDSGWGYGYGYGWGSPSYTVAYEIPVGTFIVDLVDPKAKEVVWQGKAHGDIRANKTNEEREKKLISIIAEMFAGYPPGTTPPK